MTPFEKAAKVYEGEPCARTFTEDLEAHLINGYVFSTDTAFVMGRPVQKDADYELVTDPWHKFSNPDSWMLYLAAGDINLFIQYVPYDLPFLTFERKNKLRHYRLSSFRRKFNTC